MKQLGPKRLRMTLREGRNRQVRRMLEALGYDTLPLTRTAFMGISGADVPRGYWRDCDEVCPLLATHYAPRTAHHHIITPHHIITHHPAP